MNQEQLLGIVRWLVATGCGYLIGKGLMTAEQATLIGGAAVSIVPLVWTYIAHTNKSLVASAQSVPAAQVVVSDPKLASEGVQVAPANAETVKVDVPKPA